jgi:hypothetical protein
MKTYLRDEINVAVVIFSLGTGFQVGAQIEGCLFAGRTIGGIGIGMFPMVTPLLSGRD